MIKNIKYLPFYIIVLALFIGITAKSLFTDGMFMDGLWYAVISRNLAQDMGSFWDLYFSQTVYPHFHEHPPLAMGLQSILFRIFGDSILIERFYSFFSFLFTGWIMVLIWKSTVDKKYASLAWISLLFWVITPLITWCVSNNMLENTMMIFTSLAVLFTIKSLNKKRYLNLSLAGIMIYLGFITKGPVALFPLSSLFWIFILNRDIEFKRLVSDTLVISLAAMAPVLIIYLMEPESIDSLMTYFNKQVVGSLRNARSVDSRFYILENLINNLIPVGILLLFMFLITAKKKIESRRSKWVAVFIAIGLSGVIPIMVSLKQSSFYILASIPFFSIALAEIIAPRVYYFTARINYKSKGYQGFKWISYSLLSGSIFLTAMQYNRIDRDQAMVEDVYAVIEIVPENSILSIQPEISEDWALHGYFNRYAYISIDFKQKYDTQYLIVQKGYISELIQGYEKNPVELNNYELYEKVIE